MREPNQPKRVDWATEKKNEKEMFLNVIFCDEASVEIENETSFVWVHSDDPYGHISMRPKHPQRVSNSLFYFQVTIQRFQVMIWFGISMMGPTEVKILGPKEALKSEDYSVCDINNL